jgi:phenylacetate-CoA ligase
VALTQILKKILPEAPQSLGTLVAKIPYRWRPGIGRLFRQRQREIENYERMDSALHRSFIFERFLQVVRHAYHNVPFYQTLYEKHDFHPDQLQNFDDIYRVPIVSKAQLRRCDLEKRSFPCRGRYIENTGGSAGSPLAFYIMPSSIPHEWAHMHVIWQKLGYRQSDLKLSFGGRNLKDVSIRYDALRHHFAVNIYHAYDDIARALGDVLRNQSVHYLHGYPSALYDFACYCELQNPELGHLLASQLRGAFLSSEYPTPLYREKIETVFQVDSMSWYGHTERSALAWERHEKYYYEPFQTYGYAEAVIDPDSGRPKLVATSYYNRASPFIRYDTGDEIKVEGEDDGVLTCFSIQGGREGDYVMDRNGKRIALTGLIFGRHHGIFKHANFVQIFQREPGYATILVTPRQELDSTRLPEMFDSADVAIKFSFQIVSQPIRTASGKVTLKV